MLIEANLPTTYWGETVLTACYLQNRLPVKDKNKTPFEIWHGIKPNLGHIKVFGCKVHAHVPREKRNKLEEKAKVYTFIGYSQESKAYRLLDRHSGWILVSKDVQFVENENDDSQVTDGENKHQNITLEDETDTIYTPTLKPEPGIVFLVVQPPLNDGNISMGSSPQASLLDMSKNDIPLAVRMDNLLTLDQENDGSMVEISYQDTHQSHKVKKNPLEEPKTPQEALSSPNSKEWKQAMLEELQPLKNNNTWTLERPPKQKTLLGCKWVYKIKKNQNIEPVRFKARLVAQGFSQK